jgi:hypothetical protein
MASEFFTEALGKTAFKTSDPYPPRWQAFNASNAAELVAGETFLGA